MLGLCPCWSLHLQIRSARSIVRGSFSSFWFQLERRLLRGAVPDCLKQPPHSHCCTPAARRVRRWQPHVRVDKQAAQQPVPWGQPLQLPSFLPLESGRSSRLPGSVAEVSRAYSSPFCTLGQASAMRRGGCVQRQAEGWPGGPRSSGQLPWCSEPTRKVTSGPPCFNTSPTSASSSVRWG